MHAGCFGRVGEAQDGQNSSANSGGMEAKELFVEGKLFEAAFAPTTVSKYAAIWAEFQAREQQLGISWDHFSELDSIALW